MIFHAVSNASFSSVTNKLLGREAGIVVVALNEIKLDGGAKLRTPMHINDERSQGH